MDSSFLEEVVVGGRYKGIGIAEIQCTCTISLKCVQSTCSGDTLVGYYALR